MSDALRDAHQKISSCNPGTPPFIWPLGKTSTSDAMNTSYGPRIDAARWDFHDGIDLPAAVGTPVHAMAAGTFHRAGPAYNDFGSRHILLKVVEPLVSTCGG
jgi:murein DD-endopeptidase MepM/ murein hydrolase activator NlpD